MSAAHVLFKLFFFEISSLTASARSFRTSLLRTPASSLLYCPFLVPSFRYLSTRNINTHCNERTLHMKAHFYKSGKLTLRSTQRGRSLYISVSTSREMLIREIEALSSRTHHSPSKILNRFIERAYDAGVTLD